MEEVGAGGSLRTPMPLTPEEKARRHRERLLAKAKEYQTGTYVRKFVAPLFQRMIRAEAGSDPRPFVTAVVEGKVTQVPRRLGQCVCATCGKVDSWTGGGPWAENTMHTGHFLALRRNAILFEEDNVAPQCNYCNYQLSGAPESFRKWMIAVRGPEVVERLERLKATVRSFTTEELVDLRIGYQKRLVAAVEKMKP